MIIAMLAMLCNLRLDLTFQLNEKSLVLDITFNASGNAQPPCDGERNGNRSTIFCHNFQHFAPSLPAMIFHLW